MQIRAVCWQQSHLIIPPEKAELDNRSPLLLRKDKMMITELSKIIRSLPFLFHSINPLAQAWKKYTKALRKSCEWPHV